MTRSLKETQEMLDFCASHRILAKTELITPSEINEALDRLAKEDVKYHFIIAMQD